MSQNDLNSPIDFSTGNTVALVDEDVVLSPFSQSREAQEYSLAKTGAIGHDALSPATLGRDGDAEGGDGSAHGCSNLSSAVALPSSPAAQGMAERLHPGVVLRHAPCTRFPSHAYAHFKRAGDIACAAIALVVLLPVILGCALAVKATSPGPVFFKQERWGRKKTRFECWKFRTMVVKTPPNLPAQDFIDKEAFMTPAGDFLRRWSLDELPQLLNIVKGDMSIVGPRPVIIREECLMDLRAPFNADAVRPGLTGWAQINGRNLVDDEEKAFLDGEYVANMSFGFDVRVFFRTIAVVVSRHGVDRRASGRGVAR